MIVIVVRLVALGVHVLVIVSRSVCVCVLVFVVRVVVLVVAVPMRVRRAIVVTVLVGVRRVVGVVAHAAPFTRVREL